MHVKRRYNQVEIAYNWFRLSNILFSILILAVLYGAGSFLGFPFPVWVVLVLLWAYFFIVGCVNKTNILITDQHISVGYSPLPWVGVKQVETRDIKQLYVLKKKAFSASGYSVLFVVYAVPHTGEDIPLTEGFAEKKQALYIRQEVEKYLGIDTKDWLTREIFQ